MGAAQPGLGAAEQDPQVTEKAGVEQEVALVAGSQSSPPAAVSLPQVEASTRNPVSPLGQESIWENPNSDRGRRRPRYLLGRGS